MKIKNTPFSIDEVRYLKGGGKIDLQINQNARLTKELH